MHTTPNFKIVVVLVLFSIVVLVIRVGDIPILEHFTPCHADVFPVVDLAGEHAWDVNSVDLDRVGSEGDRKTAWN